MTTTSIIPTLKHSRVRFITGSQGLYGEDTLRQVADQSRIVASALADSDAIPVTVEWQPVLTDSSAIRQAILEANADDSVVGIIAWMHTFSPAKMWIAGLDALRKPLLHLHTQVNRDLPWADIDFDFMNLNQSAHGDREFGYIESRLSLARTTVVGHVSDPAVTSHIGNWARAAAGRADIRSTKVARFGDNMRYVAVTEGDKTEAELRLGVEVNSWPVTELVEAVDSTSDSAVDSLITDYLDQYDVAIELHPGGERAEALRDGARIELGLRMFLEDGGFTAFTDSFEDLGSLKQLPGLAVQRLMADGYGFGAEGDWKTATLVRAAAVMGAGLPGGASLMEDYTYHLEPGNELILGAHMLEVSPSLATARPRCEIHPLGIGGKDDPVRLVFTADPGPAVVVSLTDMRDRFRLVANVVVNVALPHPMPNLPVGHAIWRPQPDLRTSATAWLMAGAAHHTVMSTQIGADVFAEFARMSGIEILVIDRGTTIDDFERQLRSNATYYRLAQSL
ncbi:MAG: L-arabinose isomerase [Gordonia sp. (in: high G+C Gram-positive bacteria)]